MGYFGIARIHMCVLSFLSIGLLVSISWFEKAWNDVQISRGSAGPTKVDKEAEKTDWERMYWLWEGNMKCYTWQELSKFVGVQKIL